MERLLLYWDDLDDLAGAAALLVGSLARRLLRLLKLTLLALIGAAMVIAGAHIPPLGLAFATILFVTLLYHRVTTPPVRPTPAA